MSSPCGNITVLILYNPTLQDLNEYEKNANMN